MKKERLYIEHPLRSQSLSAIWEHISTAEGLSTWLADDVKEEQGFLIFTWGDLHRHHEIRRAQILKRIKNNYVRLRWEDDEDSTAFLEMRIKHNDLTNEYLLNVTDFADEEDIDSLADLWEDNFDRLHRNAGM